jgi:hypothetical protein
VSTRELLSRPYACILLANSTPDRPTQDNHFFEALLVALVGVMEQVRRCWWRWRACWSR